MNGYKTYFSAAIVALTAFTAILQSLTGILVHIQDPSISTGVNTVMGVGGTAGLGIAAAIASLRHALQRKAGPDKAEIDAPKAAPLHPAKG